LPGRGICQLSETLQK